MQNLKEKCKNIRFNAQIANSLSKEIQNWVKNPGEKIRIWENILHKQMVWIHFGNYSTHTSNTMASNTSNT